MKLTDEQKYKLLRDYSVWEERFDKNGMLKSRHLVLPNLGDAIYDGLDYHFLTTKDNEQIYFYNGGYYEPKGEQIIKDMVEQLLEKQTTEHFKNEVCGYIRDKNYQDREIFDTPLNLINLKNGVYNLETKKLLKHDPKYYFLNELPVKYDPSADCPKIKKFLQEVVYKEDIPVIQEFFGYCLYRRYHIHRAAMFLGGGKNGKSTTIKILEKMLGKKNVTNKELQRLMYDRFSRSALYGKLLNAAADISDKALKQTGLFKMLTGEDSVNADVKFKSDFDFTNYAKFLFSANILPKSEDESYAFYRRWILISFPNTFEGKNCNPNILKELTTENEISGLFNWSIEGLEQILQNGDFSYGKTVEDVMEQYKTLSDPVYAYCQEFLKCVIGSGIVKEKLRGHYVKWCKKNKLPVIPANMLTGELKNHLPDIRDGKLGGKGKQKTAYMNIDWQDNKNPNPDTKLTGVET